MTKQIRFCDVINEWSLFNDLKNCIIYKKKCQVTVKNLFPVVLPSKWLRCGVSPLDALSRCVHITANLTSCKIFGILCDLEKKCLSCRADHRAWNLLSKWLWVCLVPWNHITASFDERNLARIHRQADLLTLLKSNYNCVKVFNFLVPFINVK